MAETQSLAERQAAGRQARERTKRSDHRVIGNVERDPIELLEANSRGRVESLVPLRYGRMAVSPFTFFRGSAILQAHDLAGTPNTGITFPICGDAHLMNFGGFATPERQQVFDLNDFDEVATGPWEWDVKRLAGSLAVAGRHMRVDEPAIGDIVRAAMYEYRDRMNEYAERSALQLWYELVTFDRMMERAVTSEGRRLIQRAKEKGQTRTHESVLRKMAIKQDNQWIMQDAPPAMFHPGGPNSLLGNDSAWAQTQNWKGKLGKTFDAYLATLASERRSLLRQFELHDVTFKVVGVGSVGTVCLVMLMVDSHDKPLFLQVKEARQSVVAQFYGVEDTTHQGERVVSGQRLLQAASDLFLGWTTGPAGRHFYFRQLRDMKYSADIERLDNTLLQGYARACGWALARAHAKASGKAVEIAAYLGSGESFADALVDYALACATQNEKDYEVFMAACRSGKLEARSDEDMAADFRV
ncbi:MAG TPA: DUF2252 domain-containing protein [Paraburkholderia sp.]|uniref:DUF2252 domain-containing protein n=1 Tax=Paraburkholderia sp. TaxID=1926495 RepID=UPI002B4722E3|nr:DUF2252 domain-containing protein [Paraburkholderia sp.]HKR42171.1 DUF2252 domain-containing protein [Paraburkholderia sp.]